MRRVASRQNARVKELRRAFAEATPNAVGEVAVEGMHIVEEAIRSGLRLSTVFFSESATGRVHKLLPQLSAHTEALLLPESTNVPWPILVSPLPPSNSEIPPVNVSV